MVASIGRVRVFYPVYYVALLLMLFVCLLSDGRSLRQGGEGYRASKLEAKAEAKRLRTVSQPIFQPKIVGGVNSAPGDYPWMAGLLERGESDPFLAQFCGGALIHPYWVLTAAHCVEGMTPGEIDVLIGSVDLGDLNQGERIAVVEIIMHPDYDPVSFNGDAALLRLAAPSSAPVLRVNSDTMVEIPGLVATILGWGALDPEGNNYPEVLQEAQVPLVDFATANTIWEETLTPNMIAAGNLSEGGVDSCSGDSGGPLLLRDLDGEWTLAGLTSFGDGCALPDSPGIYTRVSQIRPWLLNILSPRFAAWEAANDVLGESRDADGDFRKNFDEFAFGTDPSSPDASSMRAEVGASGPIFTFRRPLDAASELKHTVHYRATLADAVTELDLASQLLDSVVEGDTEIIRASFPAGVQGFITVEAERPAALAYAIRPVAFPGRAVSTISPELQQDSFGRFYQDFTFSGQPLGEPVNYLAESNAFDVILEVYDPTGSTVLATSSSNSAGGGNEALAFTATSVPIIRVLDANGLGGGFSLTAFTDIDADGQVGLGGVISGALSTSDDFDDLFDGEYYKRDYRLVLPPGFAGVVSITLTSQDFDPYLVLLDALTGELVDQTDFMDEGSGNSQLVLDASINSNILIRVTTFEERETGAFTLTAE